MKNKILDSITIYHANITRLLRQVEKIKEKKGNLILIGYQPTIVVSLYLYYFEKRKHFTKKNLLIVFWKSVEFH